MQKLWNHLENVIQIRNGKKVQKEKVWVTTSQTT